MTALGHATYTQTEVLASRPSPPSTPGPNQARREGNVKWADFRNSIQNLNVYCGSILSMNL